ncbi:MAG: site-specific integrase [Oscillospiraceae bacterium]|nr:site-specific integrase [Oscillospiraceae bacterium]
MKRRANGEGSIRQLKNGSWEARIMKGFRADGKPNIKTFTSKKRAVAAKKLAEFIAGVKREVSCPTRMTTGQWMTAWLDEYVACRVRVSTRASYENIVNNQIIPRLGHIRLASLKNSEINAFYQTLLQNGRVDGTGGLSVKSVRNVHIVLHRALREAVLRGYIGANPAAGACLPSIRAPGAKKPFEVLTLKEQRALIPFCGQEPVGMAVITALSTGLRLGELLGLRWDDIDFDANTIRVSRQLSRLKDYTPNAPAKTRLLLEDSTKTNASARVIPIDALLAGRLLAYKNAQEPAARDNMVFTGRNGGFLDPATFRYNYVHLLSKAGVRRYTIHALRHTFATRALEAGVPIKAISQILGHTGSVITMDTYSHVLPAFQAEAMTRIAHYIAGVSS